MMIRARMKMICPSRLCIGLCLGVDGRTIRGIGERILGDCTRASLVAHQLIDDGWMIGLSGDGDVDGYCDRFATAEEARERLERLGLSHLGTPPEQNRASSSEGSRAVTDVLRWERPSLSSRSRASSTVANRSQ